MRVRSRRILLGAVLSVLVGAATLLPGATGPAAAAPALDPAAVMALLDTRAAAGLPADIADYGVDPGTGKVVVDLVGAAPATDRPALTGLLAEILPSALDLRTGAGAPRHHATVAGGDTIVSGTLRCTVGFTATGGGRNWLLTAGHCTRDSDTWYADGKAIGGPARTAATGLDVGAIPVTEPGWRAQPDVGTVPVTGSRRADVGDAVCLYGSTSGKVCGVVTALDRTVNFEGTMQRGMTATSICSHEGDSGGGYVTADGQAQGIHSGGGTGTATCVSYFTPVSAALSAFGLRLLTR